MNKKYILKQLDAWHTRYIDCQWVLAIVIDKQIDIIGYFKSYDHAEMLKAILESNQAAAREPHIRSAP